MVGSLRGVDRPLRPSFSLLSPKQRGLFQMAGVPEMQVYTPLQCHCDLHHNFRSLWEWYWEKCITQWPTFLPTLPNSSLKTCADLKWSSMIPHPLYHDCSRTNYLSMTLWAQPRWSFRKSLSGNFEVWEFWSSSVDGGVFSKF
jgi:hypothetical protein